MPQLMTPPYIIPLPYRDPAQDCEPFANEPCAFFLDSSLPGPRDARHSFWGLNPESHFESREGFVTVDGRTQIASPLEALKTFYQKIESLPCDPYLPFAGGLVGFLSYEWGAALENIAPPPHTPDLFMPDAWFGFYDTVVLYDHAEKTCRIVSIHSEEKASSLAAQILTNRNSLNARPACAKASAGKSHEKQFLSPLSRESFLRAVEKIQNYLQAGDCYQVNLTRRFSAPAYGPPWNVYRRLRSLSPAPYACFLNGGSFQILSSSPELFLLARPDGTLITRPIKGTRRRGVTVQEDETLRRILERSEKDGAELLMITDLERNDLGKVCIPGSVEVLQLKELQSLPQVHHLHSTIRGKRKADCNLPDCLAAMLPGGSITGAPKIRAMEIIRELEPVPRGLYTGILGYLGPGNTGQFNISIRTVVVQDGTAFFHAGSGIVVDSDPQAEYEETMLKAKAMMEALGL